MKIIIKTIALLLILAGMCSCDNDDEIDMSNIDFSNIENLYAQPLPVIQKAVQGKWKIVYAKGGIAANTVNYYDNSFVEFTADKRFIFDRDNFNGKYNWAKDDSYYTYGDFMTVMTFQNPYHQPLLMEQIFNDTLIFFEYQVSDCERFYCVKSTNF